MLDELKAGNEVKGAKLIYGDPSLSYKPRKKKGE